VAPLWQERLEAADAGTSFGSRLSVMPLSDLDLSGNDGGSSSSSGAVGAAATPASPAGHAAAPPAPGKRLSTTATFSDGTSAGGRQTPKASAGAAAHAAHGQFVTDRFHGTAVYFVRTVDGAVDMNVAVADDSVVFGVINSDVLAGFESALTGLVR
jgi:hypothetical protein